MTVFKYEERVPQGARAGGWSRATGVSAWRGVAGMAVVLALGLALAGCHGHQDQADAAAQGDPAAASAAGQAQAFGGQAAAGGSDASGGTVTTEPVPAPSEVVQSPAHPVGLVPDGWASQVAGMPSGGSEPLAAPVVHTAN